MGRPRVISNEDMLAAAREVFVVQGVFGSTKEIARRAGVSESALFKRFSSKAQLFIAAMAPPTPGIEPVLARAAAAKSGREGVHILSLAVLDYFRTAIPLILPLVSQPGFDTAQFPRQFHNNPAASLLNAIASHFRTEDSRGRLDAPEPVAAAGLLVTALHSVALFEIMGFHEGSMPKAAVRLLVDAVWRGLEPRRARKGKGK